MMDKNRGVKEVVTKWENGVLKESLEKSGEVKKEFITDSNISVKRVYTPIELDNFDYVRDLGMPGEYPFTRGIFPTMYRSGPWVFSQYAGFGTADESNKWYKYLLSQGAKRLAIALDLPTQMGLDSDHPLSQGEVGKAGVAINSLRDIEVLLDGIPLESMGFATTANSMAAVFLSWMLALADKQGLSPKRLYYLSIQNDVIKEYLARGTQIFPPKAGIKFSNDVVEFGVKENLTTFSTRQICGYHIREAGATAPQELGFALSNAIAYNDELLERGLNIDDFAPRLRTLMGVGMDFFEEIAKIRALRRMWARLMKEKYGAKNPKSMALDVFLYTMGSMFTAQEPLNNVVRGTVGTLAAALAGQNTLIVSSYDEALALPSEEAVKMALRTQQIVAYETGITNTVDPLGGSYYVEALTNAIEEEANHYIKEIETKGGAVAALEKGYQQSQIAKSAYEWQKRVESGDRAVIGVNMFISDKPLRIEMREVRTEAEKEQIERINALKRERDNEDVKRKLSHLRQIAKENGNTVYPILEAVKAYATIGEICDTLREVWGTWKQFY